MGPKRVLRGAGKFTWAPFLRYEETRVKTVVGTYTPPFEATVEGGFFPPHLFGRDPSAH